MSPDSPPVRARTRRLSTLVRALALLLGAIAGGQLYARGRDARTAALAALAVFGVAASLGSLLLRRYRRLLAAQLPEAGEVSATRAPPGEPAALPRIRRTTRPHPRRRRRLLRDPGEGSE